MTPSSFEQHRFSLNSFLIVLLIVLGLSFYMIAPYMMALAVGAILSLLARPMHKRLQKKFRPNFAAALTTLLLILVVIVPVAIFCSVAAKEAMNLGASIGEIDSTMIRDKFRALTMAMPFEFAQEHLDEIRDQAVETLKETGKYLASGAVGLAKSLPGGILQAFLACLACFFFLVDGPRLALWIKSKVPLEADVLKVIATSFKDTAISMVWASMAAAVAQGVVMLIAFLTLGLPGAFVAAGATFIFAWIPLLGSTPVFITGMIMLAVKGTYLKAGIMLVFGLVAGIVDNFVRPLVLKGRGEMHPLVSLVAIFGGLNLFGFFGVFLGPIIAAIAITLLQIWPIVGKRHGLSVGS